MPSKTFFNLPGEKRNKLILSAIEEFSNNCFIDVSINKIINSAGIPRGSFYMYFEDKIDLFEYIIDSYTLKLKDIVKNSLISTNGDLRSAFVLLFDDTLSLIKGIKYKMFFKNVFVFLTLNRDKFLIKGQKLFEDVKLDINTTSINIDDLEFIFTTLMHTLFIGVSDALRTGLEELEREKYLRKLDMICYGFYKK